MFHTTTGLRAVDPNAAVEENAWVEVGKLRVGHVLYRLSPDGQSYDLVPIESIQIEHMPDLKTVHGLHLREGDRSYHADGFLVAVNYPEITIKSVARALLQLDRPERVKTLYGLRELSPLFGKLGIKGVDQLLHKELKTARHGRMKTKRHVPRLNLQDLRRTLKLEACESIVKTCSAPDGYQLPSVEIFDGVLVLDGRPVERTTFDTAKNTLQWSREVHGVGFEHGLIEFRQHGLDARGAVLISDDENPTNNFELDGSCVVAFKTRSATTSKRPATKSQGGPADAIAAAESRAFLPINNGKGPMLIPRPKPTRPPKNDKGPMPMPMPIPIPIPIPDIDENPSPNPSPISNGDNAEGNEVSLLDLEDGELVSSWDEEWYFDTYVDSVVWPPEVENRETCVDPHFFSKFGLGIYYSEKENGLPIPAVLLSELDQLVVDYNATVERYKQLPSFYHSYIVETPDRRMRFKIEITSPAVISALSDQHVGPATPTELGTFPTKNLTFTKIGSSVVIPLLFVEADLEFDRFRSELHGAVYEFNGEMAGFLGDK